ncbi:MAG: TraB/GumN family protein [Chitinophagaceae bacterium]|nr:TraB/GumN family protein [Chitinophagaceae bacterium]
MKRNFLQAALCLLWPAVIIAQQSKTENALLWKVTGNGLKKPSYLFGTYHFLSSGFVDTLETVKTAYKSADAVVGELVIDTSLQRPMLEAAVLKGTTLQQVLPDTLYAKASDWFKQEAGLDIGQLNQLNPVTVLTAAMAITKGKYFPNQPGEVQLDTYFQEEAKKEGKKVLGLETIQMQIKAMFEQLTLQRQVELLDETFKDKDALRQLIGIMNNAYISQNLNQLQELMYGSSYRPEEMKILLDDRNNYWMQQLPGLMKDQSLFVAVGALHLVGNSGLVNQLKEQGYTVTPVNLKKK